MKLTRTKYEGEGCVENWNEEHTLETAFYSTFTFYCLSSLSVLLCMYMPKEFIQRLQVINGLEGDDFYKVRHVPSVSLIVGKSFVSTLSFLLPHIQTHKNKIDNHSIFIHQMNDYRFSFCPKIPSCHIIIHSFVCLFKIASLQPAIYFNSPSISIFFY